jgi:hypothetical protein
MGIVHQWNSEWGYVKWEDYLSHNMGDDFQVRCLSYSNEQVDGICESYNIGHALSEESPRLHNTYDETGVTDELASVLHARCSLGSAKRPDRARAPVAGICGPVVVPTDVGRPVPVVGTPSHTIMPIERGRPRSGQAGRDLCAREARQVVSSSMSTIPSRC